MGNLNVAWRSCGTRRGGGLGGRENGRRRRGRGGRGGERSGFGLLGLGRVVAFGDEIEIRRNVVIGKRFGFFELEEGIGFVPNFVAEGADALKILDGAAVEALGLGLVAEE